MSTQLQRSLVLIWIFFVLLSLDVFPQNKTQFESINQYVSIDSPAQYVSIDTIERIEGLSDYDPINNVVISENPIKINFTFFDWVRSMFPILIFLFSVCITFTIYVISTRNNFVDKRKDILRTRLQKQIEEEPFFDVLIQGIGKDCMATYYFSILLEDNQSCRDFIDDILKLRSSYSKAIRYFRILIFLLIFILILWIIIILKPIVKYYKTVAFGNFVIPTILILIFIVGVIVLFGIIRIVGLKSEKYNYIQFRNALDYVLSYYYKSTYKDRRNIVLSNNNDGNSFKSRYEYTKNYIKKISDNNLVKYGSRTNMLDIGCGDGVLETILDQNIDILGIDVSEPSIKRAEENNPEPNKKFEIQNALRLSVQEGFYDIIVLNDILEHFILPDERIRYFKKFLKQNGTLIATIPALESIANIKNVNTERKMVKPRFKCKSIEPTIFDGINYNNEYMEHFWLDHTSRIRFPHRLYSETGVKSLFKEFKSIRIEKIIYQVNGIDTFDSYLVIAHL